MTRTTWHTMLSCISNQSSGSQLSGDVHHSYVASTADLLSPPKDLLYPPKKDKNWSIVGLFKSISCCQMLKHSLYISTSFSRSPLTLLCLFLPFLCFQISTPGMWEYNFVYRTNMSSTQTQHKRPIFPKLSTHKLGQDSSEKLEMNRLLSSLQCICNHQNKIFIRF